MVGVKIFVEGGGNSKALQMRCQEGFKAFLAKTGIPEWAFSVDACGSREDTFRDFRIAFRTTEQKDRIVLLVDSEGPVKPGHNAWDHLKSKDKWNRPANASEDQAHLMVQCMESWFLADRKNLAKCYGKGFNEKALPSNPKVEEITKDDAMTGLENATRQTQKGRYGKGKHSFEILGRIDPDLVETAAPHAARLIDHMKRIA